MAHADWIIDPGPGAGHDGGRIVFEGRVPSCAGDGTEAAGPVRHLAMYQAAWAGLRICMSQTHDTKDTCERSRPGQEPRTGGGMDR